MWGAIAAAILMAFLVCFLNVTLDAGTQTASRGPQSANQQLTVATIAPSPSQALELVAVRVDVPTPQPAIPYDSPTKTSWWKGPTWHGSDIGRPSDIVDVPSPTTSGPTSPPSPTSPTDTATRAPGKPIEQNKTTEANTTQAPPPPSSPPPLPYKPYRPKEQIIIYKKVKGKGRARHGGG